MNGNGWKQALITGGIAAITAFGGLQVGLAESRAKQEAADKRMDQFQASVEFRLNRLEDRIDVLIEKIADSNTGRTRTR